MILVKKINILMLIKLFMLVGYCQSSDKDVYVAGSCRLPLDKLNTECSERTESVRNIILHSYNYLSPNERVTFRQLSRRYCSFFDLTFFGKSPNLNFFGPVYDPHMRVTPFSSEISQGLIGQNILNLLITAKRRIIIASDKCTNEEFLDDLIRSFPAGGSVDIKIVTGPDEGTGELMKNQKYFHIGWQAVASNKDNSGKMHNKFIIVDDSLVITGSPNLTYAAYNYNIESFIAIYHRFIARLYFRYYEYIVSGENKYDHTREKYRRVQRMMEIFNSAPGNPIKVCLAPILDIKSFIISQIDGLKNIKINMFLVSRASTPDTDIVYSLLEALKRGGQITLKVDQQQYDTMRYMQAALSDLARLSNVYTVSKKLPRWKTRTKTITPKTQFHDKLLLIEQENGQKKLIIGSAGFTDHVQDNLNLENMALIEISSIYDQFLLHFNAIDPSREDLTVTKL